LRNSDLDSLLAFYTIREFKLMSTSQCQLISPTFSRTVCQIWQTTWIKSSSSNSKFFRRGQGCASRP